MNSNDCAKKLDYIIPGIPLALARPRLGHGHLWDSQSRAKVTFGLTVASHNPLILQGPLLLSCCFYFPSPKRKSKEGEYHYIRPDLSNLIKFVEDSIKGVLYTDDCQIACIKATKFYSNTPRTEFSIIEINNDKEKRKKE